MTASGTALYMSRSLARISLGCGRLPVRPMDPAVLPALIQVIPETAGRWRQQAARNRDPAVSASVTGCGKERSLCLNMSSSARIARQSLHLPPPWSNTPRCGQTKVLCVPIADPGRFPVSIPHQPYRRILAGPNFDAEVQAVIAGENMPAARKWRGCNACFSIGVWRRAQTLHPHDEFQNGCECESSRSRDQQCASVGCGATKAYLLPVSKFDWREN